MNKTIIYLDNNGTTKQSKESIKEMTKWLSLYGNPSTDNILSKRYIEMIEYAKQYILKHCGVSKKNYTVVFTSGGSESNCFIIRSTTASYAKFSKKKPHIIISAIEHNSIIDCCDSLLNNDTIELTKIKPNLFGIIDPIDVEKEIRHNTSLISIMYANNEIGSINNIKEIGDIAHKHNIPLHTDAVQIFGKLRINLKSNNIDAISVSFHKLYSPTGIGMMVISNDLINGYELESIINGSQQYKLRGGTESVPQIAGAIKGMQENFKDRNIKNKKLLSFRNTFIDELNQYISFTYLHYYLKHIEELKKKFEFVFVLYGPHKNDTNKYLPNTVLFSVVSHKVKFCNIILKKELEKHNIIISIGSACATKSKTASHVIQSMDAPLEVKRGTIRISFGDYNTEKEINKFIQILIPCINKQVPIIKYIKSTGLSYP